MAVDKITLTKPLGTDNYNIDVFNSNSTKIENAVNNLIDNIVTLQVIEEE